MHWLPWWAYPAACCFLAGGACGWLVAYPAGYYHRELVELGRRWGRLLAHRQRRAYREVWRETLRLSAWGADAVARVNARAVGR